MNAHKKYILVGHLTKTCKTNGYSFQISQKKIKCNSYNYKHFYSASQQVQIYRKLHWGFGNLKVGMFKWT